MERPGSSHFHHLSRRLPLAMSLLAVVSLAAVAQTRPFVSFDAPDAGTKKSQGTYSVCINTSGATAGYYIDENRLFHGFVRLANGQLTEFDVPGFLNTYSAAINRNGYVVGYAGNGQPTNTYHGFIRKPSGQILVVDPPGSSYTILLGIDSDGDAVGSYNDSAGTSHGFLRNPAGSFTIFDAPNAGAGIGQGTGVIAINDNHEVVGSYVDSASQVHGLLVDSLGNYESFDTPGFGTQALSINSEGTVVGIYYTTAGNDSIGNSFIRDTNGNLTTINMPGVDQTFVSRINDSGVIVGEAVNNFATWNGFQRSSSGQFFPVRIPVPHHVVEATAINSAGRITGLYTDLNGVAHGFIQ